LCSTPTWSYHPQCSLDANTLIEDGSFSRAATSHHLLTPRIASNDEANGRADPKLPLLPQPAQRTRARSPRCVPLLKRTDTTLFGLSSIDIITLGPQDTRSPPSRTWALPRYFPRTRPTPRSFPSSPDRAVVATVTNKPQSLTLPPRVLRGTGPRCHRLHRQRHHATLQLPALAAPAHPPARPQPRHEHPARAGQVDP